MLRNMIQTAELFGCHMIQIACSHSGVTWFIQLEIRVFIRTVYSWAISIENNSIVVLVIAIPYDKMAYSKNLASDAFESSDQHLDTIIKYA